MGQVHFPSYYPCGEFISFGGLAYTQLDLNNLTAEMAIYWRVKKWKATVVVTPGSEYGGGPQGTFIQYGYWNANSEEELCCHESTYFLNDPAGFGGEENPWASSHFGFAFTEQKPYIYFSYSPLDETFWQRVNNIEIEGGSSSTLQIQNFSPSISVNQYKSEPELFSAYISLQIRAEEYWSYGGTYDTSTGRRL